MIPYRVYSQINIGSVTLPTWWLCLGLAFLIPTLLIWREAKRRNLPSANKIINLCILIFISGIIGAHLGYMVQFPHFFSGLSDIFKIWKGVMFYGGITGALLASWFYIRKEGLNFLEISDLFAPRIGLGIFIGRIGCSLVNDHSGAITSLPWGILWFDGVLRHPVAEYLALNGLLIFLILGFWEKRRFLKKSKPKPGLIFLIFFLWYAMSRFSLDFARAKDNIPLSDPHIQGLTYSQWISLGIMICFLMGIIIFILRNRFFLKIQREN